MEPPEEYGFDFDQVEENFDDFMDDEEAMVIFLGVTISFHFNQFLCANCFHFAKSECQFDDTGSQSISILQI